MFRLVDASAGQARLAAAEAFVLGFTAGTELLLVGATRDAIDDLVRGLAPERGATFGLHRFSLTQLAAQLAAVRLAERGLAPASGLGVEVLAAHCAFEAAREGALEYFLPVVHLPGFGRALARTLNELRMARVEATALARLGARGADLARLLVRYDARLRASRIADRAALFETATEALRDGTKLYAGRALLLLDVELGSPVERDFVRALCADAPALLATVPAGDELAHAALAQLIAERSSGSAEGASRPIAMGAPASAGSPPSTSLERLRVHLFSESTPERAELDASVRVFSAPGEA
ncbi:MAG TPA: hypothetical protein VK509_12435, partial [Polyangiales bacterium]|nr:hypothetical protein [Polyangiales bacterium]